MIKSNNPHLAGGEKRYNRNLMRHPGSALVPASATCQGVVVESHDPASVGSTTTFHSDASPCKRPPSPQWPYSWRCHHTPSTAHSPPPDVVELLAVGVLHMHLKPKQRTHFLCCSR